MYVECHLSPLCGSGVCLYISISIYVCVYVCVAVGSHQLVSGGLELVLRLGHSAHLRHLHTTHIQTMGQISRTILTLISCTLRHVCYAVRWRLSSISDITQGGKTHLAAHDAARGGQEPAEHPGALLPVSGVSCVERSVCVLGAMGRHTGTRHGRASRGQGGREGQAAARDEGRGHQQQ